ncbi:Golgi phosphoprotein 3 GPP34 [Enteractinococcus coprophilus]|uniref:Golgi phosphoprotein 3 GPP34 n=2 Tax=Enteractinococcus coprophilus TaxID=1027633 RepID=A0A543AJ09_9MICC|nr:Golgi phosphoprotein 3 GPP34 [Enteractinococcus coprophilus]
MSEPQDTKKRPLNLAEYYLLTCLDHHGKLLTQSHTVRVGLAGAILTDLARRECLYVTQELVMVNSTADVDLEEPLAAVLQIMTDAPENQDAEHWINRFSRPALMDAIIEALQVRGDIAVMTKRFFGLVPRTRYVPEESYGRMDMYVRLRATLLGRDTALDASTWPLVQLLYSTDVLTRLFPGLQNKTVKERLEAFHMEAAQEEPAIAESLQAVENAMAESLTATRGQATGMRG